MNESRCRRLYVLKPVKQITGIIYGEQYPTLSCIIPFDRGVQTALIICSSNSEVASRLKIKLLYIFDKRFGGHEINKTVAKARFMDPRFKKVGFGIEPNADNVQQFVVDELRMLETQEAQFQVPNRSLLPSTSRLETPTTSSLDSQQITS